MSLGPLALAASVLLTLADPDARLVAPREIVFPFMDDVYLREGEHEGGKLWKSSGIAIGESVPLIVFVHGITYDGLPHHWLTRDPSGPWDARPFLQAMVDEGRVPPLVVAVPSQTRDHDDPTKLFLGLDLDAFVDAVDAQLAPDNAVDRSRVVVVGHSAAACYPHAAAFAALDAKRFTVQALFAIDGCLSGESGELLATTRGARNVVATYETWAWERDFDGFLAGWQRGGGTRNDGTMHVVEQMDFYSENLHLEIVERTLEKWLPLVLPATPQRSLNAFSLPLPF